ncbi:MAG: acyltransferase [Burkholderiaceae bacterium]|nr:MAG: acyltransferase [Burkholderiaceae bacterium]
MLNLHLNSTMNQASNNNKNSAIETLRAAAVLLVFAHHLHSGANIAIPFFSINGGWLGVQIFFVISGYLIFLSASQYQLGTYATHRFFRIYPAYFCWFLVFSVISGDLTSKPIEAKSLLIHLLFLQHFFPEDYFNYNALYVSWTLSVEVAWYIIAFLFAKNFSKAPVKITVLVSIFSCLWVYWLFIYYPSFRSMSDIQRYFFAQNNVIAQLPFFLLGALIAKTRPKLDKTGLAAIFLSTVIFFPTWAAHFQNPIFITGLGISALFLILNDLKYTNPKPISLLSDISYSFYLIHYPIIVLVAKTTNNRYSVTIIALALTIAISYISYRFIEKPFIKIGKLLQNKTKPSHISTEAQL